MPRLRKCHLNKSVVFATTTVEEGLLFPPNPIVNAILWSCLARAQAHHPVGISAFTFESTHAHFMFTVDNPDDVAGFMCRFKTESAHAANALIGRPKRTVWCEGYDSPIVLTADDVIRLIQYIYLNPAKDNLCDSIEIYPGLSSWHFASERRTELMCPWIHRGEVPCLFEGQWDLDRLKDVAIDLIVDADHGSKLIIEPYAWMDLFGIHQERSQEAITREIRAGVLHREAELKQQRLDEGRTTIGVRNLMKALPEPGYQRPARGGRRTWCISSNVKLRKRFISYLKRLSKIARYVYKEWKKGNLNVKFPLGLYPPSIPKLAQPLRVLQRV